MNKFNNAVLPLALSVISAFTSANLAANEQPYQELGKQIEIMEDIFTSAIKNDGNNNNMGLAAIESMYLAKQGVVFTVKSKRNFHFPGFSVPVPVAPVAPMPPAGFENSELFGEDLQVVIDEAMEEAVVAMEYAHENMRMDVEKQRQLREQERELAYELRDIERENRDLAFKKRTLDKDELKEFEKQVAKLEQRKKDLLQEKQQLAKKAGELKAEQDKLRDEQRKQQQAYFASLQTNLSEILCTYGAGLKALPGDEHVSLIIKDAAFDPSGRTYKDQVLVFAKSDIKKCLSESIDAKGLLKSATTYQL
ncbi:hypothetical protein [Thalassotalea mangrovi]|uniref:Uncharacterized protein n=1 Tax=Thalassotalea mangrovi TaxID=2572245 RepID=A0A4U1B1J6_9GAMM|nr:hypothetical protein [Thalassotalea mangrovi]TKB43184.1 hypothetical protein E8M12_15625 [Thalassotalea mangrovi]